MIAAVMGNLYLTGSLQKQSYQRGKQSLDLDRSPNFVHVSTLSLVLSLLINFYDAFRSMSILDVL